MWITIQKNLDECTEDELRARAKVLNDEIDQCEREYAAIQQWLLAFNRNSGLNAEPKTILVTVTEEPREDKVVSVTVTRESREPLQVITAYNYQQERRNPLIGLYVQQAEAFEQREKRVDDAIKRAFPE